MSTEEVYIHRLQKLCKDLKDHADSFGKKSGDVDKSLERFMAHVGLLEEERKKFLDLIETKLESRFSKAFEDHKHSLEELSKNHVRETLSELKNEAQKTVTILSSVKVENRLNRYLMMGSFCLGVLVISLSIQWYFPHKHEHNYHLSREMLNQIKMGQYATIALDQMSEKDQKVFQKYFEKAARTNLKNR